MFIVRVYVCTLRAMFSYDSVTTCDARFLYVPFAPYCSPWTLATLQY